MLSSEHPSGPSCSSKSAGPGVRADPVTSAAEAPTCQDPRDLVQPCSKFSIRDYVFGSRSKGVKRSWPFQPNSLRFCLKRGVKDPLPPFEPPDLIRSQPFDTSTNIEQSAAHSEVGIACVSLVKTRDASSSIVDTSDINFQSSQLVDESSLGPSPCTSPEDGKSGIDQVSSTNELDHTDELIPIDPQDNSWTKECGRTEVAGSAWQSKNLDSLCEISQKKCKYVVKLGTQTDIQRTEEIANSSSVSDPMASKTCPVCKLFASSSNTTLNAHIDQCLSVESNSEPAEMVPLKSKMKTKKNNTLSSHIDHCPSVESNTEIVEEVLVKPKLKPRKERLMVDIYETALPYTVEDLDQRNDTNWAIELAAPTVNNEVCTENRSPEVEAFATRDDEREGDVYIDSNGIKIRILSNCSNAPVVQNDVLGTKRVPRHETGKGVLMRKKLLKAKILKNKKLRLHGKKYNKVSHLNPEAQAYPHGGIDEETIEEMYAGNPAESTSHDGSGTMRQWACSKRSDISKNVSRKLCDKTFDKVASGAQKMGRSRMLGFDSSHVPESHAGAFFLQPPKEMDTTSEANGIEQSNDSSRLLRLSSKSPLQNNVLPRVPRSAAAVAKRKIREIGMSEANKSENYDTIKNSNSVKRFGARSSFSIAGRSNGPNKLASSSKKFRKQRTLLRTGRRTFSSSDSKLIDGFGRDSELDTRHASKKFRLTSNSTLKKFVKNNEGDTADNDLSFGSDMPLSGQQDKQYDAAQQTEGTQRDYEGEEPDYGTPYPSVSRNDPADSYKEISCGSLIPEDNRTEHDISVEGYAVGVEDPSTSEQSPCHANETNSVVNNKTDDWLLDPASTKESSACLTNNRDMGPADPQDNSSITSNREDSNQEHGLPFGRESLDSPVSTASTMSPTALKDSRTKESEPGPSTVRAIEEQITVSLEKESKSMPVARVSEQLPNEKPFCCSCRGNISRESQLHHETETARPMLNFSGKQISHLHIGLTASSSFSTYQRSNTKANPFSDSHDQPLAAKVSAESSMNLPSYTAECMSPSLQTQLPSPSNPILRLMGKNLMVMNNGESVHPPAPSSDYILRGNYVAPVGFVSPNYQHPSGSAFLNMAPVTANRQVPLPSIQAGRFVGPPLHNSSMMQSDHHSQQKSYRSLVPVMRHHTYTMKEVIVIDDSPERRSEPQVSMLHPPAPSQSAISVPNTVAPRPFYSLPSPPFFPRERAAGSLPVFSSVGSMVGVNSSSQGSQTEVGPFYSLPSPPILPRERAAGSVPVFSSVGSMVGVNSSSQGSQIEAGPFYSLPPPPILPRAAGSQPVFSSVGVNSSSQGSQTEAVNPYMQSPFFVHPQTGYINPSVYYSQNLRR